MLILGQDLRDFRKLNKIRLKDLPFYESTLYRIEKTDHQQPFYGQLEYLLGYYMDSLKSKNAKTSNTLKPTLAKLGSLEREMESVYDEIQELEKRLVELKLEKIELEKKQYSIKNNLNDGIFNLLKNNTENAQDGILLNGTGSTILSSYKLEKGIYTVSTTLPAESISFALLIEPLDDKELHSLGICIINNNQFYIKENGYYLFYAFATEGQEWSVSIKKLSAEAELLESDLDELELSDYYIRHLNAMGIKKVKDLTKISMESLDYHIDKQEVQQALQSVGLTMERESIQKINSIEDLDFSARTFNCLDRAGIKTVELLIRCSPEKLSKIRNFGQRSLQEVIIKLEELGLNLMDRN